MMAGQVDFPRRLRLIKKSGAGSIPFCANKIKASIGKQ
jgi:hypothetical protein